MPHGSILALRRIDNIKRALKVSAGADLQGSLNGGADEARTRDLRLDRPAF